MHARGKIFAGAVVILIIGTAISSLAARAQSQPAKPDPSKSSYASVNEEDFGTVLTRNGRPHPDLRSTENAR
jgi:hypothetical protein